MRLHHHNHRIQPVSSVILYPIVPHAVTVCQEVILLFAPVHSSWLSHNFLPFNQLRSLGTKNVFTYTAPGEDINLPTVNISRIESFTFPIFPVSKAYSTDLVKLIQFRRISCRNTLIYFYFLFFHCSFETITKSPLPYFS